MKEGRCTAVSMHGHALSSIWFTSRLCPTRFTSTMSILMHLACQRQESSLDCCKTNSLDSVVCLEGHPTICNTRKQRFKSGVQVVLEARSLEQLRNLASKLEESDVKHKLWIEQPENFATALATKPYPRSQVSQYFKKFNLCKATLS
jgi:hypothetical protein